MYSTTIIIHASINSNLNHPVTLFYLPQQPLIPSTTTAIRTPAYQPQQPFTPSTTKPSGHQLINHNNRLYHPLPQPSGLRTSAYQPQQPFIPSNTIIYNIRHILNSSITTTITEHNLNTINNNVHEYKDNTAGQSQKSIIVL